MSSLLLYILLFPLIGAILNGLVLRSRSPQSSGTLATLAAGLSFVGIAFLTLQHTGPEPLQYKLDWFSIGTLSLSWGFAFDSLTAVMGLVVTGIGTLIHLYSIGYMEKEPTPSRYFAYLNLFLFAMLLLIFADNLPVLFVGWEGVGFCSYLLIGYWYEDPEKAKAGMKAFIVNRIGDAGFLIGIFLCFSILKTLQFSEMSHIIATSQLDDRMLDFAAFFLFIGAVGKSAQIPLFVWLPDAMAGPTPVSALIHAATMVTAGVYLVARMSFLFQVAPHTSALIATIGVSTALFAASIAVAQRDIKKVLAYSTVSQLGFMFLALGVGAYTAAVFHIMTHAFFKALLFLGAGSVIHACGGEQDIYHMGGLKKHMPWTWLTFAIAVLAIAGIPPLSGFFSKDTILYYAMASEKGCLWFWGLGSFASLLTAFYMGRLFILVFLGDYRGTAHPHESPATMTVPLILLAVGSAFAGFLGVPHGLHFLPNFIGEYLSPVLPPPTEFQPPLSEPLAMGFAVGIAVLGLGTAYFLYSKLSRSEAVAKTLGPIKLILENKYWVDELFDLVIVRPFRWTCLFLARIIDVRVIDALFIFPTRVCRAGGTLLSFVQSGAVQFYLLVMLVGSLIILWFSIKDALL